MTGVKGGQTLFFHPALRHGIKKGDRQGLALGQGVHGKGFLFFGEGVKTAQQRLGSIGMAKPGGQSDHLFTQRFLIQEGEE